ncbi:MAG TPA: CRISPR-associated endonuclease Cas1, partial [Verrucomicrobiota bacterium]|nr:CRISPR-associated endonuclease Cas1 [Verrucomicrobiota bacterium]
MSYHIVSIDAPNCSLSCRDGQLTCRTDDGEKRLPLEDVAAIVITSFSASIHSHLFLEAAPHGVALIICEAFKPVSLVLPANRSTDTLLSRALLDLEPRVRASLWQRTVDAKCQNQHALARHIRPGDLTLESFRAVAHGRQPHKEAVCARAFWQIFGRALNRPEVPRATCAGAESFVQIILRRAASPAPAGALVAVVSDATELKSLEARFVQSQKMQA